MRKLLTAFAILTSALLITMESRAGITWKAGFSKNGNILYNLSFYHPDATPFPIPDPDNPPLPLWNAGGNVSSETNAIRETVLEDFDFRNPPTGRGSFLLDAWVDPGQEVENGIVSQAYASLSFSGDVDAQPNAFTANDKNGIIAGNSGVPIKLLSNATKSFTVDRPTPVLIEGSLNGLVDFNAISGNPGSTPGAEITEFTAKVVLVKVLIEGYEPVATQDVAELLLGEGIPSDSIILEGPDVLVPTEGEYTVRYDLRTVLDIRFYARNHHTFLGTHPLANGNEGHPFQFGSGNPGVQETFLPLSVTGTIAEVASGGANPSLLLLLAE